MLKKLRIKFIVTTMVIVVAMLCTILGMVYHFTKTDLESESIATMKAIAERPANRPGEHRDGIRLPYFSVQLGMRQELLSLSGNYYDLSDTEFVNTAVEEALDSGKQIGILEAYNLRFYQHNAPFGHTVVFMDMSTEQAALKSLVQTAAAIGFVSLLAFLGISILLARWAVAPVDKAWKQQRQFVSDASHELKTPLTVIMANAELLENADDPASAKQYTANILTVSRQMRHLLEQMLTLARSDNNQSVIPFCRVDFSQVVADAVLPFEPVFFEKGLALEYAVTPGICVAGIAAQLRQIADILLDNAQKYARGKTVISLEMRGRSHCILSVANEGDPIPPEDLQNLFKRFYRQDEARSRDGSFGLGLSIAETIVTHHKGKIRAESRDGINRFTVELPTIQ